MSAGNQIIDKFFNLGNKVTNNDPVRKSYFDYCLYWIVFATFVGLSINYFYKFYETHAFGYLGWGLVVGVFSWFNYWALISFRNAYLNMKKFYNKPKQTNDKATESVFTD